MGVRTNYWPTERDEELKRLYALTPSLSSSQIAAELNCGLTRNAVIGRIHRLGLPLRGRQRPAAKPKAPRIRKQTSRVVWANGNSDRLRLIDCPIIECGPVRDVAVEPRNVPLADLVPADCRYPYGEGAAIVFCGHPKIEGSSYCGPHFMLSRFKRRTIDEAVLEARSHRMRKMNYRQMLARSGRVMDAAE